MKCPYCSNQAKSELGMLMEFSFHRFSCQYCNTPLRGNPTMIALDAVSVVAATAYVIHLFRIQRTIENSLGYWALPTLCVFGVIAIKMLICWAQAKSGKCRSVRKS